MVLRMIAYKLSPSFSVDWYGASVVILIPAVYLPEWRGLGGITRPMTKSGTDIDQGALSCDDSL